MICILFVFLVIEIVVDFLLLGSMFSKLFFVFFVMIWELGEVVGLLFIVLFLEMYGWYLVMNVCNIIFILVIIMMVIL